MIVEDKRPTIADVARVAGVSKSTVSRVLNDRTHHMRDETRQSVMRAMHELGYRPSSVARSLVSKRTQTVGLLISDIGNPFYSGVIQGVEDIAMAAGYDVFLCNTNDNLKRGVAFVESLTDKHIDGAMLMCSGMTNELVIELARNRIPTVVLEPPHNVADGVVRFVAVEFEAGIQAAVDHLLELGHRKLAHVSGPLYLQTARLRRDIFVDRAAAQGIDPAQIRVVESNFRVDGGRQALAELLSAGERPTAVFAGNDLMALGILWAAREAGLRVPGDLAVIGLDDIELAAEVSPSLTTVALPQRQIGEAAMHLMLELISLSLEPRSEPALRKVVPTRLVVRQSTGQSLKYDGA